MRGLVRIARDPPSQDGGLAKKLWRCHGWFEKIHERLVTFFKGLPSQGVGLAKKLWRCHGLKKGFKKRVQLKCNVFFVHASICTAGS